MPSGTHHVRGKGADKEIDLKKDLTKWEHQEFNTSYLRASLLRCFGTAQMILKWKVSWNIRLFFFLIPQEDNLRNKQTYTRQ